MVWLSLSIPVMALVVVALMSGGRLKPVDARLLLEGVAIAATAITSGIAAFSSIVPGRSRTLLLLPLVPLLLWLVLLGEGCAQDWIRMGEAGLHVRSDPDCALAALLIAPVPA